MLLLFVATQALETNFVNHTANGDDMLFWATLNQDACSFFQHFAHVFPLRGKIARILQGKSFPCGYKLVYLPLSPGHLCGQLLHLQRGDLFVSICSESPSVRIGQEPGLLVLRLGPQIKFVFWWVLFFNFISVS